MYTHKNHLTYKLKEVQTTLKAHQTLGRELAALVEQLLSSERASLEALESLALKIEGNYARNNNYLIEAVRSFQPLLEVFISSKQALITALTD